MTLRFVPFELAMADALVPMWREAFEHGVGIVDPNPIEGQRAYLIERVLPAHDVTVALEGERIVGFVASNAASVGQLYVRVGCHGRGIGRELLRRAMAASAGSLWLHTFRETNGHDASTSATASWPWHSASNRLGSSTTCATNGSAASEDPCQCRLCVLAGSRVTDRARVSNTWEHRLNVAYG